MQYMCIANNDYSLCSYRWFPGRMSVSDEWILQELVVLLQNQMQIKNIIRVFSIAVKLRVVHAENLLHPSASHIQHVTGIELRKIIIIALIHDKLGFRASSSRTINFRLILFFSRRPPRLCDWSGNFQRSK